MSENYFYPSRQTRENLESAKHNADEAREMLTRMKKAANGRTIAFPKRIARLSTTISKLFTELGEGVVVLENDEYYRQSKAAYEAWQTSKTCGEKPQETPTKKPVEKVQTVADDGSLAHPEKTVRRFKEPKQKYHSDKDHPKTNGKRPRKEMKRARKISVHDYK